MYFITTGTSGEILGLYVDAEGYPEPPQGSIQIDEAIADQLRADGFSGKRYINGALVDHIDIASMQRRLSSMFSEQIQIRLDNFAATRRYNSVDSVGKYKNLTDAQIATLPLDVQAIVKRYRAECEYLALKTAQTWAKGELLEARVRAGNWPTTGAAQYPSGLSDIESELPVLDWDEISTT